MFYGSQIAKTVAFCNADLRVKLKTNSDSYQIVRLTLFFCYFLFFLQLKISFVVFYGRQTIKGYIFLNILTV